LLVLVFLLWAGPVWGNRPKTAAVTSAIKKLELLLIAADNTLDPGAESLEKR
jgi:hypothetical protein